MKAGNLSQRLVRLAFGILALTTALGSAFRDRVFLDMEHVDFRVNYSPGGTNELFVTLYDSDGRTNYAATNVVLVVRAAAGLQLPEGFPELGEPGSPFWILPQSQDPQLLYLGASGEGLPRGVFGQDPEIRLASVQAAGAFFAWRTDGVGNLRISMDSRNGLGPEDVIATSPGGHSHYNWGFSSNGFYQVTFQAEGRLAGASTNLTALPSQFLFAVEPLPVAPESGAELSVSEVGTDGLELVLSGVPGAAYCVEMSPDLESWSEGPLVVASPQASRFVIAITDPEVPLFIRAVSLDAKVSAAGASPTSTGRWGPQTIGRRDLPEVDPGRSETHPVP